MKLVFGLLAPEGTTRFLLDGMERKSNTLLTARLLGFNYLVNTRLVWAHTLPFLILLRSLIPHVSALLDEPFRPPLLDVSPGGLPLGFPSLSLLEPLLFLAVLADVVEDKADVDDDEDAYDCKDHPLEILKLLFVQRQYQLLDERTSEPK